MRKALIVATLLIVAGCATEEGHTPAAELESAAEEGRAALAPFKADLMAALAEGMAEGTVAAIEACNVKAPGIATANSGARVVVGRTSHRLRNPHNTAPDWVAPILEGYLADPSAAAPEARQLDDGRRGYVEPIRLQGLCLACHGSELQPAVAERIATLYPQDAATGFSVGDLRGVFWVELP